MPPCAPGHCLAGYLLAPIASIASIASPRQTGRHVLVVVARWCVKYLTELGVDSTPNSPLPLILTADPGAVIFGGLNPIGTIQHSIGRAMCGSQRGVRNARSSRTRADEGVSSIQSRRGRPYGIGHGFIRSRDCPATRGRPNINIRLAPTSIREVQLAVLVSHPTISPGALGLVNNNRQPTLLFLTPAGACL